MTKRFFFLALAAGLVASLASATPSRAGFITGVTATNNTGMAVTDIETTWTGTLASISNVDVKKPAGSAVVINGETIIITFDAPLANGGDVDFTFTTKVGDIEFASGVWSFESPTGVTFTTPIDIDRDKFRSTTVPEPTSMCLLGVGMAVCFRFRRLFKRAAA